MGSSSRVIGELCQRIRGVAKLTGPYENGLSGDMTCKDGLNGDKFLTQNWVKGEGHALPRTVLGVIVPGGFDDGSSMLFIEAFCKSGGFAFVRLRSVDFTSRSKIQMNVRPPLPSI